MASKGRKKASLLDLSRERWVDEDIDKITVELIQGSDRAAAIISAALVGHALTDALSANIRKLSATEAEALFHKPTAPLQTFFARILIAYAIGVYGSKLRDELNAIRHIRNAFAHSVRPISFSDPPIREELDKLRPIDPAGVGMINAKKHMSLLRGKFVANCVDISKTLRAYAIDRVRQSPRGILISIPDQLYDEPTPLLHKSIPQRH